MKTGACWRRSRSFLFCTHRHYDLVPGVEGIQQRDELFELLGITFELD